MNAHAQNILLQQNDLIRHVYYHKEGAFFKVSLKKVVYEKMANLLNNQAEAATSRLSNAGTAAGILKRRSLSGSTHRVPRW
jgi:hypothetical protein